MAKVTISYEFDYFEEKDEVKRIIHARDYWSILWELDQEIRSKVKYGDDKWLTDEVIEYLDKLRDMISENGLLYDE